MNVNLRPIGTASVNFPGFQCILDHEVPAVETYTKLLLHLEGADAATDTVEETGKAVTFVANAQLDTAAKKFGNSSCLFDGTLDAIYVADSADFAFGSGDFVVDFWVRRNATGALQYLCGQIDNALLASSGSFHARFDADDKITFTVFSSSTPYAATTTNTYTDTSSFYHIALVRDGNTLRIFVNGVADGTADVTGVSLNDSSAALSFGRGGNYTGNTLNGWLDEIRVSKGTNRGWTANFIPPGAPYDGGYSSIDVAVNSDTDLEYYIVVRNLDATNTINCLLNYALTGYGYQYIYNNAGSISAARGTDTKLAECRKKSLSVVSLLCPVGFTHTAYRSSVEWSSGTTVTAGIWSGTVHNSTSPVTAISFRCGANAPMTSGTRITVFARRTN
jgi:hypothetical protein